MSKKSSTFAYRNEKVDYLFNSIFIFIMASKICKFDSYRNKLAAYLSRLAPLRNAMSYYDRAFFNACCVDYFLLVPPLVKTDFERLTDLEEILNKYTNNYE